MKKNNYLELHPVEIEEGLYTIENYYGKQVFNNYFPSWEEAQNFIDTIDFKKLLKECED